MVTLFAMALDFAILFFLCHVLPIAFFSSAAPDVAVEESKCTSTFLRPILDTSENDPTGAEPAIAAGTVLGAKGGLVVKVDF